MKTRYVSGRQYAGLPPEINRLANVTGKCRGRKFSSGLSGGKEAQRANFHGNTGNINCDTMDTTLNSMIYLPEMIPPHTRRLRGCGTCLK